MQNSKRPEDDNLYPKQNYYHPTPSDQTQYRQPNRIDGGYQGMGQGNLYQGSSIGGAYQQDNAYQGTSTWTGQSSYDKDSSYSWNQPQSATSRGDNSTNSNKSFYGKGPKGFKRSDERIQEEVSEALYNDHAVDASEIEVTVENGEVTLSGTVENRQMKRLAEDCTEKISGVYDVRNQLRVQSHSVEASATKTTSAKQQQE